MIGVVASVVGLVQNGFVSNMHLYSLVSAGYITNLLLNRHPVLPGVLNAATNLSLFLPIFFRAGFVFQALQGVQDIGDLICRQNTW